MVIWQSQCIHHAAQHCVFMLAAVRLIASHLLGFSHTTVSRFFTQNGAQKNPHQVNSSSVDINILLISEVRGERTDWLEQTERLGWLRQPLFTTLVEIEQHIEPWGGWFHAWFHYCQSRTGTWGWNTRNTRKHIMFLFSWTLWSLYDKTVLYCPFAWEICHWLSSFKLLSCRFFDWLLRMG